MSPRPRLAVGLVALAVVVAAGALLVDLDGREETTVTFVDDGGAELATVEVVVADSFQERYTGLSDTESLGPNEGMLFVHPAAGQHTYVMRDMSFPIDIVFVAPNGTITTIHHAELPEDGGADLKPYRGRGKFVVELPYGFTNRTGIDVGDRVRIPPEHRKAEG